MTVFFTHLKPSRGNFWNIAHRYKLFASKYISYDDSLELSSAELHLISLSQFVIYLLSALAYLCITWHIPRRMFFSTISKISILVNNSKSTSVFFKQACHANPGVAKKWARSSSYISIHLFLKISNTSASNNVLLWTYKSW